MSSGGRDEGTANAATTFRTKSNKALSTSWVPDWVEVVLKRQAALNWMQAIQASLRKVDQRASTMLHVITAINSTCAYAMVKDLQQVIDNGTKRQEDMSLAILLQQVALGITGHGSQTTTTPKKTQSINPSMMKILSDSIVPLEVALSSETNHLGEWLRDIAKVATQALKLKVEAVQIKDEAMQMANQIKEQQISLEKRHAQRNGYVLSTSQNLLSPDNFYNPDCLQAVFVDIYKNYQQGCFQTLLANLD